MLLPHFIVSEIGSLFCLGLYHSVLTYYSFITAFSEDGEGEEA
jgi:hypothetical protein